jgi:hypothetical protein
MTRLQINSRPRFYTDIIRGILTLHGYRDVDPRHIIADLEAKGVRLMTIPFSELSKEVRLSAEDISDPSGLEEQARAMGL